MLNRVIVIGATTHIPVTFIGDDGYGIDFTVGSRVARLRLTVRGATAPTYTLDTTDSGEFSWTSQADGEGEWLFESDDVFAAGDYVASVVYTDPAQTPDDVFLLGEATYTIRNPNTGAL
jgi:hypothetical protein